MISGRNDLEHLQNLKSVLPIVKSNGFRLRFRKCAFLQPRVTHLGFQLNEEGTLPSPEKVEIIKNAKVQKM